MPALVQGTEIPCPNPSPALNRQKRRRPSYLASRKISPDGVTQLSEEASSGVRLAVVVNIVFVSVIAQSTGTRWPVRFRVHQGRLSWLP